MMALGSLISAFLTLALPLLVGWWVGTRAARVCTTWYAHAALCGAAMLVAMFSQYAGMYFAIPLWLNDAPSGREPPVTLGSLVVGFVYYGWIGGIISGPITLGGYLVGYLRTRDRGAAPKELLTFPKAPID